MLPLVPCVVPLTTPTTPTADCKDERDAELFLETVLLTQPRPQGEGAEGSTSSQAVVELGTDVLARLPLDFDVQACMKKWPLRYLPSPLTPALRLGAYPTC